eukprot:Skav207701  [mRNA]  locus=scaffold3057:224572:226882:- [translate_table: standard]
MLLLRCAFVAGHAAGGSLQQRLQSLAAQAQADRRELLQQAPGDAPPCHCSAPLWQLASLALASYAQEPGITSGFRPAPRWDVGSSLQEHIDAGGDDNGGGGGGFGVYCNLLRSRSAVRNSGPGKFATEDLLGIRDPEEEAGERERWIAT